MSAQEEEPAVSASVPPPELSPDSYTAKRLQHASPAHIHATSRRCFIGPIPEAWLSRHRKSWYHYRPHLSTYSSKTATFDASTNVSLALHRSSIDSQSAYSGPSFPQPDDLEDENESPVVQVEPLSPDTLEPSPEEATAPLPRSKAKPKRVLPKTVSFRVGSPSAESSQPRRPNLSPLTQDQPPGSFVTAKEDPSELSPVALEAPTSLQSVESEDDRPHSSRPLPPRESYGSSTDTASPPSAKEARTANSTSSLLRYEGIDRTSSKASAPREDSQSQKESEQEGDDASPPPTPLLRELNPVSTGLVHFSLPKKPTRDKPRTLAQPKPSVLTTLFQSHTQPGELIKAERMLIRVDWTKNELPSNFNENESLRIESLEVEKWREFMVVCRRRAEDTAKKSEEDDEQDDDEESFLLQMSKSRVIPMIDQRRTSSRAAHEITLHRKETRINMFSSLDKTIVLWSPWTKGTRIYMLRPRSSTSAVEWFTFLNVLLGWKRPETIPVNVPDLNVTLQLDKPFQALRALQEQLERDGPDADFTKLQDSAKGSVAHDIIDRSIHLLHHSPVAGNMATWLQCGQRIGIAWKRYDRLEWVHGANEDRMYGSMAMQQSHDLELRLKQHYPTTAIKTESKHKKIEEPTAVEGFLVRLTSQRGRHKRLGKAFFKRLYFSTHNQYLCFCQPAKALPPKPSKVVEAIDPTHTPTASALAEKIPLIYPVDPFPLDDGEIAWTKNGSARNMKKMDQLAVHESERKMSTLLQTQGYINLCHVVKIRKSSQNVTESQPPSNEDGAASDTADDDLPGEAERARATHSAPSQHVFELVLKNGLTVRLQAYDSTACREWIKRLRRLSAYWKARTSADMNLYKDVRRQNLKALDIDEEMESTVGQFAQKWEVTRAIASAELFNMCGISCCRSITMSGVLYYKPSLRAKFQRCTVMLCYGKLLLFQSTLRKNGGKEIPHIHHERQHVLDLQDTYVYSGMATEGDLLYRNQTFDSNNPGHHSLPRVYLEDQWTSSDEDYMTCFAIWHRRSRTLFKAQMGADGPDEGTAGGGSKPTQKLRYVSSLGRPGRSMVFKARSRVERDHWVMNISLEADRIAQTEDLRLT